MLLRYLLDHHLVIGFAAVLEQDGKDFPHGCEQGVLILCMLKALMDHLVETEGVYEQPPIDSVN